MKAYILLMRGKQIVHAYWSPKLHAASLNELFDRVMQQMTEPFYAQYHGDWDTLVIKVAPGLSQDGAVKRGPRT